MSRVTLTASGSDRGGGRGAAATVCEAAGPLRSRRACGVAADRTVPGRRAVCQGDVLAPRSRLSCPGQFVSLLPADADGVLSFEGYAQVLAWWKLADADVKLRRVFAILDLNDKGRLDAATLARALATVSPTAKVARSVPTVLRSACSRRRSSALHRTCCGPWIGVRRAAWGWRTLCSGASRSQRPSSARCCDSIGRDDLAAIRLLLLVVSWQAKTSRRRGEGVADAMDGAAHGFQLGARPRRQFSIVRGKQHLQSRVDACKRVGLDAGRGIGRCGSGTLGVSIDSRLGGAPLQARRCGGNCGINGGPSPLKQAQAFLRRRHRILGLRCQEGAEGVARLRRRDERPQFGSRRVLCKACELQ